MKKRALRKDFFMEIRKNTGRFVSIFLIVALGVAFYSGIQSAAPDMRYTGDRYFDENKLMDIQVLGTMGITEEDVEALKRLDGIQEAEPGYTADVLLAEEGKNDVLHMESLPESMNRVEITEGTLPEKPGECLLDALYAEKNGLQVGDVLEVKEHLEEDEDPVLVTHTYQVTGLCSSPLYISFERGSTTLGSGKISAFAYVTKDCFDLDVYTEVYLTAEGAAGTVAYTDAYKDLAGRVKDEVEGIKDVRCQARYQEIKSEADEKLADARQELADKKAEAEEKLADAKAEIDDAAQKLSDGRKELEDAKAELSDGRKELSDRQAELDQAKAKLADGTQKLADAKTELTKQEESFQKQKKTAQKQIKSGEKQITQAKKTIAQNEAELEKKKAELEEGKKQYEAGKAAAEKAAAEIQAAVAAGLMTQEEAAAKQQAAAAQLAQLEASGAQITEGEKQLKAGEKELASAKKEISAKEKELKKAKQELADGEEKLKDGWKEIESREAQLSDAQAKIASGESGIAEGWQKIRDGEQEIADAEEEIAGHEKDLEDGKKEYGDAKVEAEEKIADGEAKLADAQKEIDDLKVPKWYVNDRDDLMDYTGFGENADRMRNLGQVFPVLFFLVAALISLTTMTRMVEEQRTQIGTLKALGYGKLSIASKYLGYALIATMGGSVFGVLLGEKVLPFIIIHAYGILYHYIPVPAIPYNLKFAVIAALAATLCTLLATLSACYRELAATPAVLMRPPVPKQGKRVLLERITFLWKHLSFIWKSTIRNLVRYKKRFFMTIFGIGGCMALLLVGYGLRDSIMDVAVLQYGELQMYDAMILLDEDAGEEERQQLFDFMDKEPSVQKYDSWYMKNLSARSEEGSRELYVVVPENVQQFDQFVSLRDRKTKEKMTLSDDGIVLTEKMAKMLGVAAGDTISLELKEGERYDVKITSICENYMYHYAYMTPALYSGLTGSEPEYTTLVYDTGGLDEAEIEEIGQRSLTCDGALGITYTANFQSRLDDMLGTLDSVIVVLIVSAGMLAFVVLYNLNNININERKRELATIKVLGFYDGEVAAYVYRENVLLTFIGAALGCILGAILHRFVIVTVEIDICMFGRNINPGSFLYAILFTVGFSVIVNFVMYFKLKKIDMVESLKSVE